MPLRFRRRVRVMKGVYINLGKRGASMSLGGPGATVNLNPRRGATGTLGIPGTGLSYQERLSGKPGQRRGTRPDVVGPGDPGPGEAGAAGGCALIGLIGIVGLALLVSAPYWLRWEIVIPVLILIAVAAFAVRHAGRTPRTFRQAVLAWQAGDTQRALSLLSKLPTEPDARFLSGVMRLNDGDAAAARAELESVLPEARHLGALSERAGARGRVNLRITPEVETSFPLGERGAVLLYAEACEDLGDWQRGLQVAGEYAARTRDPLAIASWAQLALDHADSQPGAAAPHDEELLRRVEEMTRGFENDDTLSAALVLYRARALRRLGMADAARAVLSPAIRRKAGRARSVMAALRYERALCYRDLGWEGREQNEWARLFAKYPDYRDVAARAGVG